jgi:hypothetical protein
LTGLNTHNGGEATEKSKENEDLSFAHQFLLSFE